MNQIPFDERKKVYLNAMIAYGDRAQMIVALEELSELQKEICKILRGGENISHLAEEIADVPSTVPRNTQFQQLFFTLPFLSAAHPAASPLHP